MSNFMGVGIFWIGLNRADLGCCRLTLSCWFFWREEICSYLRYSYNPLRSEDLCHLVYYYSIGLWRFLLQYELFMKSITRPETLGQPKLDCLWCIAQGVTDLHFCDAGAHVKPFSQGHN